MVEELKLAIKVDDDAIEQALLKQFANAEKMANKVVLTFNNIDLDDKAIEAKFKEMQKIAGKNPIDLSIDKSSIEMLSAISKQLSNIFEIAKGKSIIDSSTLVSDVNKITQSTNQQVKAIEKVTSSYKNQAYELASILKMLAKLDQYGDAPYAENLSKVVKSSASTFKDGNSIQFAALKNGFTEEMLKYLRGFSVNLSGAFNYSETLGLDTATISNVEELINYFRELLKTKIEFNSTKLNTADIEELIKALGILKKEHFDDGTKTGRNIYGDGSLDKFSDISEIRSYLKQQEEQAIATAQAEQKLADAEKEVGKSSIPESQNKIQEELKEVQKQAEQTSEALSNIADGNKSNISSENDSLQSTIEALKQLSKLPGGDTLSLGKIMNHIAEGAKLANPEVKKLLETLKLIDSEGKIIGTHINEGTLNSGVDLNDKFAIISRNDAIENVDKLIEKEKEAQQQGILLARTLASVDIGKLHYDIQELAQGSSVHQMKNSTLQQFIDETRVLCNATDEQILKLYSDAQKLSDLGFKLDLNPSNIRYDENSGFSFIDLELRKINEEAPQTVAIMHTLTQSLMGFMGQRNRLNWDDEENFYTKDNYSYLQNMLKTYERLQQIFSSKLSTPDFNQAFSDSLQLVKTRIADIEAHFENLGTPIKDVFQGGSSSAEKLEQDIKNIESATDRATESAKEYRKILSQVGEFDIDSKVSAMYKRNDGQLESWTWRAKTDDEGKVLRDQNGRIEDYDEPTVTVISKYEQLEKIIVKADNELRNLQRDLAEIKAYDSNASTINIEAKITDQKEYIKLLEQTVKVISQSDEYLLDEQQIIDARNKAAREYALTMGSKQEKTDAKQSASDEKKRLANIEQVNRALNKQQITIDAIEKTYNKSTNPDLDREVSNQQDLAELAQKKLDIQTKINSLQGQERNSANEKEFLELEKLIAEYKELAKYKLKANNPSKQELGGQNLQTLIQVQISNYDKLITKAEKYGDSTTDTVEKLKEQRDILSKIGADGKYSASADQYYASRDTYKVESAALSAFEAETKAAEQEAKTVQKLAEEKRKLRQQEKQSTQSSVDKALTDQVSAWKKIQSIREKIAKTDSADEINALQESKKYYQEQYNNANKILKANDDLYDKESQIARLEQIRLETNAKIAGYKKNTSLSSMESSLKSYQKQLSDLSIKPDDAHRFPEYQAQLDSLNKAIQEYRTFVDSLQGKGIIDESDITESKRLKDNIEKLLKDTKKFSSGDKGFTNIGADKAIEKINTILKQNSAMSKKAKAEIKAYYDEIRSGNPTKPLNEILDAVYKIVQKEREAGRAGQSWLEIFNTKKLHSFLGQAASMFSFYDLVNLGREGFQTIRELDTALVDLKKTTAMNSSQLEEFYFDSNDVAKQMGVTTQAIIDQASAWSRLGLVI